MKLQGPHLSGQTRSCRGANSRLWTIPRNATPPTVSIASAKTGDVVASVDMMSGGVMSDGGTEDEEGQEELYVKTGKSLADGSVEKTSAGEASGSTRARVSLLVLRGGSE